MSKYTKNIYDVVSFDKDKSGTELVTIHYDKLNFKDTHLFSPAAHHFKEHGCYTFLDERLDKREFYKFWDEEKRRCIKGYTAENGTTISGYHYFYLNYCKIDIVEDYIDDDGEEQSKRKFDFPRFYDGDFIYYHIVDLARKKNKHINLLKARRKGYSYKNAAMLARNYYHIKRSKNFVLATDSKYLDGKDGILKKAWSFLSHIDENTPWSQPRLKDASDHKISGYRVIKNSKRIEKGTLSQIAGISLKDNPDAARGAAGELVLWEESGKFRELLEGWMITMPLVKQGSKTVGLMIAFGTGGTEGADFTSAEMLADKPDVYDCMAFNNIWDEGAEGTKTGFFHPNFMNLDGFMDPNGNSLIEEAKIFNQQEREIKKSSDSARAFQQFVAEHAESPSEAVLVSDTNQFPTNELNIQYNYVKARGLDSLMTAGYLSHDSQGKVVFKPSKDAFPLNHFPHAKKDDLTGAVCIIEAPVKTTMPDGKLKTPDGLYIIGHDPYAHDSSTDNESLGAVYVIKRVNNFSHTYNDCIVASYVGRPENQDEFNRNMFLLAEYYNAKIGFENDRGDVIGYAKRFKKLDYLEEEFEMLHKKELQSKVNRQYGMHMTPARKEQGELYVRDWLNTAIGKNEQGNDIKVLHTIYDLALLKELIKYNNKGNFDRVMAIIISRYYQKELHNEAVVPTQPSAYDQDAFFNRF